MQILKVLDINYPKNFCALKKIMLSTFPHFISVITWNCWWFVWR